MASITMDDTMLDGYVVIDVLISNDCTLVEYVMTRDHDRGIFRLAKTATSRSLITRMDVECDKVNTHMVISCQNGRKKFGT
jgi:hypothetical protein